MAACGAASVFGLSGRHAPSQGSVLPAGQVLCVSQQLGFLSLQHVLAKTGPVVASAISSNNFFIQNSLYLMTPWPMISLTVSKSKDGRISVARVIHLFDL